MDSPSLRRTYRAVEQVLDGQSIRQAAQDNRISRTTLQRRFEGTPTKAQEDERRQVLSTHQEAYLANWAITQGRLGYAPLFVRFRSFG